MLTPEQALELRAAGLSAYNHNLDTSPEFYSKITSSRKYEVREARLNPCRGNAAMLIASPYSVGTSTAFVRMRKWVR